MAQPIPVDSAGRPMPDLDSFPQALTYNGDGTVATIAVTTGSYTYTQTLTYTSGNVTAISAWVRT